MNALAFELPEALQAREPPEARGVARDGVRLLVAGRQDDRIVHRTFSHLPELIAAGDLLIVNDSATLAAAVSGRRDDGERVRVHISSRAPRLDHTWRVVELRSADGAVPRRARVGELIDLQRGASLEIAAAYASGARLVLARYHGRGTIENHLSRHGEPIRYRYVSRGWPLEAYQNVYATTPGSAEMPSAGRPFTVELLTRLAAKGVLVAPITLHCGVSSPEWHEAPYPEYFEVPEATARLVNATKQWGGHVIAVGTTVVRALETVATKDGGASSGAGWSGLVITPERPPRVVDGLITGWHEPGASHLRMLEALAGQSLISRCYEAALEYGYLWHEFGDSHLILS
jgi:S-adenosylmethionine:tRNA ribosyltransferase-isomerase